MCFFNAASKTATELKHRFQASFRQEELFQPIYCAHGFTYPFWPIITQENPKEISLYQWGLIPDWTVSEQDAFKFRSHNLNARYETVLDKPSFKKSVRHQRCLVISTGYFEWHSFQEKKYPFFIKVQDQDIFAMAGIYSYWVNPRNQEKFCTFSILTQPLSCDLSHIHQENPRMPVILPSDQEMDWIHPEFSLDLLSLRLNFVKQVHYDSYSVSRLLTSKKQNINVRDVQNPYVYTELL